MTARSYQDDTYEIIGACIAVHRALGPGLLESAYQACLARELELRGISFEREAPIPLRYRELVIERAFLADFIVDQRVVVEVKAVEAIHPNHRRQLQTYVKLTGADAGLLINFNTVLLPRGGITRVSRRDT